MKTYILNPDSKLVKSLTEKILSSFRDAYPRGLNIRELQDLTGEPYSTISSRKTDLEENNYIKKLPRKRNTRGRPNYFQADTEDDTRSFRYIIEDANYMNYKKNEYRLSPGNFEYPTDFLKACDKLMEGTNLVELNNVLLSIVKSIQDRLNATEGSDIKNCIPTSGKEYCCPNCNINHEARDFMRAILLRLIDQFETHEGYVKFMSDSGYIYSNVTPAASQIPAHKKVDTGYDNSKNKSQSVRLRLLSFDREAGLFLAIDKERKYYYGADYGDLVTEFMTVDSVVECKLDEIQADEAEEGWYINIAKEMGKDIFIAVEDDPEIPRLQDMISTISSINMDKKENNSYCLEGTIIESPKQEISESSDGKKESTITLIVRDDTGIIPLYVFQTDQLIFRKGNKILAVGTTKYGWGLSMGTFGSIKKLDIPDQTGSSSSQDNVYFKHFDVGKSVSQESIKITLIMVALSREYTRTHIEIENNSNEEIHFSSSESIVIQNKRQFVRRYGEPFKQINSPIPSGIIESGVVSFEPIDPTQAMACFRFRIGLPMLKHIDFTFTIPVPQ